MRLKCPYCQGIAIINKGRPSKMNHLAFYQGKAEQLFRVYATCKECGRSSHAEVLFVTKDHPKDEEPAQLALSTPEDSRPEDITS